MTDRDRQRQNATAPKQYYACTDSSIGAAILFDQEKVKDHIKDSKNLQAFSSLDDAEDFIMERNPETLLRRIENLEGEKNELLKRNELLKNKLWIRYMYKNHKYLFVEVNYRYKLHHQTL